MRKKRDVDPGGFRFGQRGSRRRREARRQTLGIEGDRLAVDGNTARGRQDHGEKEGGEPSHPATPGRVTTKRVPEAPSSRGQRHHRSAVQVRRARRPVKVRVPRRCRCRDGRPRRRVRSGRRSLRVPRLGLPGLRRAPRCSRVAVAVDLDAGGATRVLVGVVEQVGDHPASRRLSASMKSALDPLGIA